jgi:hypothetical protein
MCTGNHLVDEISLLIQKPVAIVIEFSLAGLGSGGGIQVPIDTGQS